MLRSLCIALCLCCAPLSLAMPSLSLTPSLKAASVPASIPLAASFAGFGIESSNLFAFTGADVINEFSVQLLRNLADFSGAPPHIRIGGNTQDYMKYDDNHTAYYWEWNERSTGQGVIAADAMTFGPSYFKALDRLPTGTPITFGLNLGYSGPDYLDHIVTVARAAVDGLKNVHLYSFEIGNEADLYLQNLLRPGPWSGMFYTQEFLERARAVYQQVLKPAGLPSNFFEPPATASTIGNSFEIALLVQYGLTDEVDGVKYISSWNQHDYLYFVDVTPEPFSLDCLMDLDYTKRQFAYWEQQVGIALKTGLPYVLREMSSYGPVGMHMISNTFGAALWTLDFFLYAATLDISSVQMHMTDNSFASAWQPTPVDGQRAHVRPQYYAHVAMAQIVGNGNGTTQIAPLTVGDLDEGYKGRIHAYAAYSKGNLQSLILLNTKQANTSTSDKGSFTFELNLGAENGDKDVYLSFLTAEGADSLQGTTFNGMSFSDSDGKKIMQDETVHVLRTSLDGSVFIPVRDSEAVVANLGYLLGSHAVEIDNGFKWSRTKKSTAGPTSSSNAGNAMWTSAFTTTLVLAGTVTGGGGSPPAEETGTPTHTQVGDGQGRRVKWKLVLFCLSLIFLGYVYLG